MKKEDKKELKHFDGSTTRYAPRYTKVKFENVIKFDEIVKEAKEKLKNK